MKPRALIAGLGNIFHGDDAFGAVVAQRLSSSAPIDGALICDFGIRGIDLVFAFLDGYELVVLVDAVSREQEPGTIYVIEPDLSRLDDDGPAQIDGHSLDPLQVLRQAARMGAKFGRVFIVGCEPASIEAGEDGRIGLSAAAEAAIEPAIGRIQALVAAVPLEECAA
jgi:hydrogenase maturation protease